MSSEGHAVATDDGVTLAFRRRGTPGAPTLLLLHGITDGAATWERVARALDTEFDLVIPDARGHGASTWDQPVDLPRLAADAAAVLDHLGLRDVAVWGHSMGAETAAHLAAHRPDLIRAAMLEDPPFRAQEPRPASGDDPHFTAFLDLLSRMRAMSPAERLAVAQERQPSWHMLENEAWAATKAAFEPDFHVTTGLGARWRDVLPRIVAPALLIAGDPERGAIVTPEVSAEAMELLPQGTQTRLAGTGHGIHRDALEDTLAAVRRFLAAHATP